MNEAVVTLGWLLIAVVMLDYFAYVYLVLEDNDFNEHWLPGYGLYELLDRLTN